MAEHESKGALPEMIRLQRHVSYFGTQESINGLRKYLDDDAVSITCLEMCWEDRSEPYISYRPFAQWPDATDTTFVDLIQQMMNLDPSKRITAEQALEHPWFKYD